MPDNTNRGHILLRDTEGWAQLFDLDRALDPDIAHHYESAAFVDEPPGEAYYLPYAHNTVLPLVVTSRTSTFDESDFATCEIIFTVPGTKEPVLVVTYRVDGRG